MRLTGNGRPFALDYGAVMAVGAAAQIDTKLLADVLPAAERAIIDGLSEETEGDVDG